MGWNHQLVYMGEKTRKKTHHIHHIDIPSAAGLPVGGQEAKDREVDLVPQMLNETPAELLRRQTHAKNKKTKD